MAVIEPDTIQVDSKSYQLALDRSGKPVWEVQSGQRLEKEFLFGGGMGETRCIHDGPCDGFFFAVGIDVTDGTARLEPLKTTAVSNLDIAYLPLHFFEDFDADRDRAVYITYRDTTTTPDIITKKIRVSDNAVVDTETWGVAAATAPVIGRPEVFAGATYVPLGDKSGSRVMQKLATVGDISAATADTWEAADASTWAFSCATVTVDGVSKFIRGVNNKVNLTSAEPKTLASYEAALDAGDSTDLITWITELSDGLVAIHTATNLWLWDSDGNTYPILPGQRRPAKQVWAGGVTYDDFPGHMSASLSAGVLHPAGDGLWFYQNGHIRNVAIDQIGQGTQNPYRYVNPPSGVLAEPPIRDRHFATVVYNQWIYSIYKPTLLSGTEDPYSVHILCGYYQNGEITWRTFISETKDIVGLFIDSGMRLWWISDPQDPASIPGTATADVKYITLNADGSPRTALGASRGAASTAYTYFFPEIDFGLPYEQKQLRLMTLETENLPTAGATGVTIQLSVQRDGSTAVGTDVGATITTAGTAVTEREPTVGTTDTGYRFRPYLTITTGASYAPTTSDPRLLRLKVEARSADMIRTIIIPTEQRNLFETKKILRKLKNAGVKTIREPQTNETFSGRIIAVNDTVHEGKQAVELVLSRFAVAA